MLFTKLFTTHLKKLPFNMIDRYAVTRGVLLTLAFGFVTACSSWVQLSPEAENVSLLTTSQVSQCQRAGTANVNALDEIGFIDRSATRLQDELVKLAKNEAARLGGNSIVPESTIAEGQQTFGVFRCSR